MFVLHHKTKACDSRLDMLQSKSILLIVDWFGGVRGEAGNTNTTFIR